MARACIMSLRFFFLLCLTNVTIQCPQHFIHGKRFNGASFKTILKIRLFSCAAECVAYSLCKSVSFDRKNMTCFLHLEEDSGQPDSLLKDSDFSYSSIKLWDNIVLGPCQKHSCDPYQKCVVKRNQKRCIDKKKILSRGKMATASSSEGTEPSKAVDGNMNSNWWSAAGCFHVTEPGGWWQVDLGVRSFITDVLIVNREDSCCAQRFRNFVLETFTEDPSVDPTVEARECYRHPDEALAAGATVTFNCTTPVIGQYFRASIPNPLDNSNMVQVCEVEVYGWHID